MDDFEFMKNECVKDSYMLFIDSDKRDKSAYANPNHYVVKFDEPFKNVFAVDVLQARIPKTQFNVDHSSNTLTYSYDGETDDNHPLYTTVRLPTGNYEDVASVVTKLNEVFEDNTVASIEKIVATYEPTKHKILFTCGVPFFFHMGESSLRTLLGFNVDSNFQIIGYDPDRYNKIFNSNTFSASMQNPTSTSYTLPDATVLSPLGSNAWVQTFTNNTYTWLDSIEITAAFTQDENVTFSLYLIENPEEPTTEEEWRTHLKNSYDYDKIVSGKLNTMTTNTSNTYTLKLTTEETDEDGKADIQNYLLRPMSYKVIIHVEANATVLVTALDFKKLSAEYKIEPPGISDLTGDPYVTLHCDEIEVHKKQHGIGRYDTGISTFFLNDNNAPTNIDFNNVAKKEFHPIGKLSQLSLRLNRPNGELYDFKTVNHQLILLIHYYQPQQKKPFDNFSLNPAYNPDHFQYVQGDTSGSDETSGYDTE